VPAFRIAQVSPYAWEDRNEVNGFIRETSERLVQRGHEVAIVAPSHSLDLVHASRRAVRSGEVALDGVQVVGVGEVLPFRSARRPASVPVDVARTIEELLDSVAFDFVHVHEPFAPSVPAAALRHSRALNVGSFHAPTERLISTQVARRVVELFFGRLDARTAAWPTTRELMTRWFPAPYELVRPGTAASAPHARSGPLEIAFVADEERAAQRRHIHQAIAIYRALLAGGVVERLDEPDSEGRLVRLTVDLQLDFALNQPLSPFALAAIELLDRESPSYPLDVLSVIESTLENPRQVLSAQQFRARGEAVAQMKADGVGYEERLELLDDVTYPKPLEDLLDGAYEIYRRGHPWVADYEVRPKAVVRDMYERALTFAEYVAFYGLSRSEGLVLRYLADAYKALRQTVPDEAKTEDLTDLIEWLGEIVRQVDSSLIDEWERLRNPLDAAEPSRDDRPATVTSNVRAFRVLVRNALFHRVRLAALGHYEELGALDSQSGWDATAWEDVLEGYFDVHDEIGTGAEARGPALLMIDQQPGQWAVRQIFDDPAGDHDWGISAVVDLDASDEAGAAVLRITDAGQLSGF